MERLLLSEGECELDIVSVFMNVNGKLIRICGSREESRERRVERGDE